MIRETNEGFGRRCFLKCSVAGLCGMGILSTEVYSDEKAYEVSKTLLVFYTSLFKDTSDELGREKALELLTKFWERRAISFAQTMKKQGKENIDLTIISQASQDLYAKKLGYKREAEITPNSIVYRTGKCPFYDAIIASGLIHDDAKTICMEITKVFDIRLKKIYDSKAGYTLKFRKKADEICVEEVILKA